MAHLTVADVRYRESYLEFLREAQAEGRHTDLEAAAIEANFEAYVEELRRFDDPAYVPAGRVPETHFWLVEGDEYIGSVRLRHRLNPGLRKLGGHIGYEIRPSRRRQGYGRLGLKLALEKAREIGLEQVLITCDATNVGSRRIIETGGGVFEGEDDVTINGRTHRERRYWIEVPHA